jgi:hypothetical protein
MILTKKKLVGLAAAGLAGALYVTSALAHLANSYDTIYYSDATMSLQVGDMFHACNGKTTTHGTVTPYAVDTDEISCGDSGYECPDDNPCSTSTTPADQGALKQYLRAVRPEDLAFAA